MAASDMDDMASRYADRGVSSVFIYCREAHPGENYPALASMDDKRAHARALLERTGMTRRILLDDFEGTAHRGYGILPNMTWIVGRGLVLYRAEWTLPADVEEALEASLDALARRKDDALRPVFSERLQWRKDDPTRFRKGLDFAGPQAVRDFYKK